MPNLMQVKRADQLKYGDVMLVVEARDGAIVEAVPVESVYEVDAVDGRSVVVEVDPVEPPRECRFMPDELVVVRGAWV